VVWHVEHLDKAYCMVSTMSRTNQGLDSPQAVANYMVIRCATVGFDALAPCRGCIQVGNQPLWVGEGSLSTGVRVSVVEGVATASLLGDSALLCSPQLIRRTAVRRLGWRAAWYQNVCLGSVLLLGHCAA
jgi:hypothetical protein